MEKSMKEKQSLPPEIGDPQLELAIRNDLKESIEENLQIGKKKEIDAFLEKIEKDIVEKYVNSDRANEKMVRYLYHKIKHEKIRKTIVTKRVRPDGRAMDEIRPIEIEIGILPSSHGSALFTRGETQSLGIVTLGTSVDEQIEDGLRETFRKSFLFHYNFPPFSVGEVGRMGTGRRELGHGTLAERALKAVLPLNTNFPYTIRIVSEILESNGSSSMASVCSGSLALMDCGVPIHSAVSGIAMGLLIEDGEYIILSDIQGLEDHYGDMDFKVAGTEKGVTALQLDIKVAGLSETILREALAQAKKGRFLIREKMNQVIAESRTTLAPSAPKVEYITIDSSKVGLIIGPGGKMIRKIEEESKASIVVSDGNSGHICISAKNQDDLLKAKKIIFSLVREVEAGDIFEGKISRITNFGAFVEVVPGKEGLLHVSTLSKRRIDRVEDYLKVGQLIEVRVKEIDNQNRINLIPMKQIE